MATLWIPSLGFVETENVQHAYTFNADGTLATDQITVNGITMTKTYSYANGVLSGESAWVKQ